MARYGFAFTDPTEQAFNPFKAYLEGLDPVTKAYLRGGDSESQAARDASFGAFLASLANRYTPRQLSYFGNNRGQLENAYRAAQNQNQQLRFADFLAQFDPQKTWEMDSAYNTGRPNMFRRTRWVG